MHKINWDKATDAHRVQSYGSLVLRCWAPVPGKELGGEAVPAWGVCCLQNSSVQNKGWTLVSLFSFFHKSGNLWISLDQHKQVPYVGFHKSEGTWCQLWKADNLYTIQFEKEASGRLVQICRSSRHDWCLAWSSCTMTITAQPVLLMVPASAASRPYFYWFWK